MKTKPQPGTKVRFTANFLGNTGQTRKSGEGPSRWHVVACDCDLCDLGGYVTVDQPSEWGIKSAADDMPPYRHIAFRALEKCR